MDLLNQLWQPRILLYYPHYIFLFVRKSVSQSLILPSIIYYVRFHLMEVLLVGTLSKAFEESMVNMSIRSPESNFPRRYCTVVINWNSHEYLVHIYWVDFIQKIQWWFTFCLLCIVPFLVLISMSRNVGHVRPLKIQISLRIRAVWSESSLSAFG